MQISELKKHLAPHASTICQELYPDGRIESGHFKIGSLDGESGRSLSVILNGEKAGMWTDFATTQHGDLLDLIMTAQGFSVLEAKAWGEKRFGIKTKRVKISPAAKTKYATPKPPKQVNTELLHSFNSNPKDVAGAGDALLAVMAVGLSSNQQILDYFLQRS